MALQGTFEILCQKNNESCDALSKKKNKKISQNHPTALNIKGPISFISSPFFK